MLGRVMLSPMVGTPGLASEMCNIWDLPVASQDEATLPLYSLDL